jgi:hypothetical protein
VWNNPVPQEVLAFMLDERPEIVQELEMDEELREPAV